MTGEDLGIYRFAESTDRLVRGQLMLVLLGRQGQNYFNCNCNSGQTLAQSIPRLESKDEPLLAAVDALIRMIRQRDRAARVELLVEGLKVARGRAVAPVLLSLGRRALMAAQAPGVTNVILTHVTTGTPAIREVAARALRALLDAEPSKQGPARVEVAKGLAAALETAGPNVAARVAVIDALGSIGASAGRDGSVLAWLKADRPHPTLAETSARLRALGRLGATDQKSEIARMLETIPLDAPAELQEAAGHALGLLDARAAASLISSRIAKKHAAGLGVAAEISLLGRLPAQLAVPELLNAWGQPLDTQESLAFAQACSIVADSRLVPAVSTLLDPRQWQIRAYAIEALTKIDSEEAASALWPHRDEALSSRSDELVIAACRAAAKLLARPDLKSDAVRDRLATLLADPNASAAVRQAALESMLALGDSRLAPALASVARDANLEGTPLLLEVERAIAKR
jgi:hypothetical protein